MPIPTQFVSQHKAQEIEDAIAKVRTGQVTKLVGFPEAAGSTGEPGNIAFEVVSGVNYLAMYTGDGIASHSWLFLSASDQRPE